VRGDDGNDQVWGDDPQYPDVGGNDILRGGGGQDTLRGGVGDDCFFTAFDSASDTLYGEGGYDKARLNALGGDSERDDSDLIPLSDIEVLS
jgi:Ca2+-binding RTX toxin-like protein